MEQWESELVGMLFACGIDVEQTSGLLYQQLAAGELMIHSNDVRHLKRYFSAMKWEVVDHDPEYQLIRKADILDRGLMIVPADSPDEPNLFAVGLYEMA